MILVYLNIGEERVCADGIVPNLQNTFRICNLHFIYFAQVENCDVKYYSVIHS